MMFSNSTQVVLSSVLNYLGGTLISGVTLFSQLTLNAQKADTNLSTLWITGGEGDYPLPDEILNFQNYTGDDGKDKVDNAIKNTLADFNKPGVGDLWKWSSSSMTSILAAIAYVGDKNGDEQTNSGQCSQDNGIIGNQSQVETSVLNAAADAIKQVPETLASSSTVPELASNNCGLAAESALAGALQQQF